MSNVFSKLMGELKEAETKIFRAEKKVTNALAVFDRAAQDVEKANAELEAAIAHANGHMAELQAKMLKANDTKDKAFTAMSQNKVLLNKLNEFRIVK